MTITETIISLIARIIYLPSELIIKNKPEWIRSSLANKAQYQKKYNESIKNNNGFWKKKNYVMTEKSSLIPCHTNKKKVFFTQQNSAKKSKIYSSLKINNH